MPTNDERVIVSGRAKQDQFWAAQVDWWLANSEQVSLIFDALRAGPDAMRALNDSQLRTIATGTAQWLAELAFKADDRRKDVCDVK